CCGCAAPILIVHLLQNQPLRGSSWPGACQISRCKGFLEGFQRHLAASNFDERADNAPHHMLQKGICLNAVNPAQTETFRMNRPDRLHYNSDGVFTLRRIAESSKIMLPN